MYLIFDFDGTLVDSLATSVEIFNDLAEIHHFKKINVSTHEIEQLKELTSRQLIKKLKIPLYKIPSVIYKARKRMNSRIVELAPFPGIKQALEKLYQSGCSLGIVTSNSEENVHLWLERYQMQHLFSFIYSESSYFRKSRILKKALKFYRLDKTQTCYIGDETRDVEAAKKEGICSIAVTWGFSSEAILKKFHPNYIAKKPEDLLAIHTKRNHESPLPSSRTKARDPG